MMASFTRKAEILKRTCAMGEFSLNRKQIFERVATVSDKRKIMDLFFGSVLG